MVPPSRYCEMWSIHEGLGNIISIAMKVYYPSTLVFQVVELVKHLHKPQNELNGRFFDDVHNKKLARTQLIHVQTQLHVDRLNT